MWSRVVLLALLSSCGAPPPAPLPDAGVVLPAFTPQQLGAEDAMTLACGGAALPDGTVFVVGTTTGALDPAGKRGQRDFFLAKYLPDGARAWVRQLGTPAPFPGFYVSACSVRVDAAGNAFVAGTANGLGSLEGKPLPNVYSAFVARFDAFGQLVWLEIIGGAGGPTEAMTVELLPEDRLVVAGYTRASTLDGAASLGEGDVFLAFFSRLGAREPVRRLGGPGEDVPSAFDVRGDRLLLATRVLTGSAGAVSSQALRELDATGAQLSERPLTTGDGFTIAALSATDAGVGLASQEVLTDGGLGGYRVAWLSSSLEPIWSVTPEPRARRPLYAFDCDDDGTCVVGGSTSVNPDGGVGPPYDGFVDVLSAGAITSTRRWTDEQGGSSVRVTYAELVAGQLAVSGFTNGTLEGRAPLGLTDSFVQRVPLTNP